MTRVLLSLLLAPESLLGSPGDGFALLFEAAVKGTLVLLFAVVLTLLLHRSSAAARHLVWTLALGATLLLPIFSLTLPAWKVPEISPSRASRASERAAVGREDSTVVLPNDQARQSHPVSRLARLTDGTGGFQAWATGILSLWAIGLILVAMRVAVGEVRVRRLVSCSQPFESGHAKFIVENICSRLGISRQVKLRISPEIGMPFTWGGFRPAIVLPEDARQWSQKQLNFVLAHELAHVSRYDYLTQMPAQAACALFWFHPLVWFAAFQMRKERERACDDMVLNLEHRVTDYAESLLILARGLRRFGDAWLTSVASAQNYQLEVRMKALLDPQLGHRPLSGRRALLATALAVALVLPVAAIHATAKKATGNISGTVQDPSGAVIPGANVTALNLETHDRISVYTRGDGSFEFPAIPTGRYQLEATKPGFAYNKGVELDLNPAREVHENIVMDVGAASEEIVVRGHASDEAPSVPPPTPRRIRVGGMVQAAKLMNHVVPVYPTSAEKRGIEGTVILRAVIGTSGQMLSLSPYNDVDPDLIGAAMEAVGQWRYQPTLLNGVPVEVVTTISVVFRLDK
jgi:TonB family protein